MKNITPIVLAGLLLALCGCSTDSPIFSNDATKASNSAGGTSNAEETRDIVNEQHSGASMGDQTQGGGGPAPAMSSNPYAH